MTSTSRFVTGGIACLLMAVVARPSLGDELTVGASDFAVIHNYEGAGRILFRAPESLLGLKDVSIWKAFLSVDLVGDSVERSQVLRVYPVVKSWDRAAVDWTTGWDKPGGDFDHELFASTEVDFRQENTTVVFDLTPILKEIVEHGMTADGFVMTCRPRDGLGIRMDDVPRFGGLSSASFTIRYRGSMSRRHAG